MSKAHRVWGHVTTVEKREVTAKSTHHFVTKQTLRKLAIPVTTRLSFVAVDLQIDFFFVKI